MRIPGDEKGKKRVGGGGGVGVYAHIPFCSSKCPYCDFSSVAGAPPPEEDYTGCLLSEIKAVLTDEAVSLSGARLSSIYIGGGTPSLFSPSSIGRLTERIASLIPPSGPIEATIEVNPESITADKLKGYLRSGINRVSVGVQSFNVLELKTLGRPHSPERAVEVVRLCREAGFANTGIDLIFGVPGQGLGSWEETIEKALAIRPEHISLYGLTIEEGTPYGSIYGRGGTIGVEGRKPGVRRLAAPSQIFTIQHAHAGGTRGVPPLPSEEEESRMYSYAVAALKGSGYVHYEISNFSLPGFESVHNSNYWKGVDYIGLGASAHSYYSTPGWGRRLWNEKGPFKYISLIKDKGRAVQGSEALSREEAMTESVILGLRMLEEGLDERSFTERFGASPEEAFKEGLKGLIKEGLIKRRGESLVLTERGIMISNEVFLRLLR